MLLRLVCGLLAATVWIPAAAPGAAPVIHPQGVQNAASFEPASFSPAASLGIYRPAGIAPGSIFLIWGSRLGPEKPAWGTMPYGDRLPDVAGGVQVTIRSRGYEDVRAWLLYVSSDQINAIVPSTVPIGDAEVIVTYDGESSQAAAINIRPSAPGLFSVTQNGMGPGVIQNYESTGNLPLNQMTRPARPGQYVVLWATGLGPIVGADNVPPPIGTVIRDLVVEVDGVELIPDYAGRAPGFPGVDQINVRLPDDGSLSEGCYLPVTVRSRWGRSQQVSMALAATAPNCQHPWDLSAEQLARLDAGESLATAALDVFGSFLDPVAGMSLSARFESISPFQVALESQWSEPEVFPHSPPVAGCDTVVGFRSGTGLPVEVVRPPHLPRIGIDVGDRLFLDGPGGRSVALVKAESSPWIGDYQTDTATGKLPDDFLTGGEWTLESAGSADLPAFSSAFTLPSVVRADVPESIDRSQDLVVSWKSTSDLDARVMQVDVIAVHPGFIIAIPPPGDQQGLYLYTWLACSAPASDGSITIPSADLLGLSPTEEGVISLRLSGSPADPVVFSIPGIDRATFSQANARSRRIEIR